jgi:type IV secretion system protein VirB11
MLSLFKDVEMPVAEDFALHRAREILVASLNKGIIPTWENFKDELPVLEDVDILMKIQEHFLKLTQWTFLEELVTCDALEFYFHQPKSSQVLMGNGEKKEFPIELNEDDWQLWLEVVSIYFKQNWNNQHPFVSFYGNLFGKSYRFSLIHHSTSPNGKSKLILRSISNSPFKLESFGETTSLPELVTSKKNILIAGSTGSGKTSLLSTLLSYIDDHEHLVILEDTFEIRSNHKFETRFLSKDSKERSLEAYLTYSLRLSPERIVLGEMRSHEVVPFLLAMNTGHKGLMGTVHSSSAVDALHRVTLLFSLYSGEGKLSYDRIMELLCRNLEYVVFMEHKKVKSIIKILGCDEGVPFFENLL